MPFALLFIGLIVLITALQDTHKEFGAAVADDFSGQQSFIWYVLSLFTVGAIGYAGTETNGLKEFSRLFMLLILISLVVGDYKKNGKNNFFSSFIEQIKKGTQNKVITASGEEDKTLKNVASTAVTVASFLA